METRFLPETRQQAIENLSTFCSIAYNGNVPFCLMDGTLLGAYREGDFIKGDVDDVDLGVMEWEYERMLNDILPNLHDADFALTKTFTYDAVPEGVTLRRGDSHIDIMRIHIAYNIAYNLARNFARGGVVSYEYPAECFTAFDEITFLGETFNTPQNVEAFLLARYVDWKTPVDRACYDWLDFAQVPNLRTRWPE